ncbi:MAG TPA: hypothetical protein VGF69_01115 [Thermoanaerobaculia bacterium]
METRRRESARSSEGRIQRDASRGSTRGTARSAEARSNGESRGGRTYDRSRASETREAARVDRSRREEAVQQRAEPDRGSYDRNRAGSSERSGAVDRNRAGSSARGGSVDRNRAGSSERGGSVDRNRAGSSERGGSYDRNRGGSSERGGSYDRNRGGSYDRNRGGSYDRNRGGHGSRQPYHTRGRVSRYDSWNGGYRVWVHGAPYPFFVPLSHWRRSPFRVGVVINIGGYYNPLGYYDYYDGPAVTTAAMRGVVESVDYRRDTFVLRNEATGSFVTVRSRGGDRDLERVRPGDYVEIDGDWSRGGVFEAYRLEFFDNDRYDRY